MFLRLTKKERTYILKSEREEYWQKRIADLEKEITDLQSVIPIAEDKAEILQDKQDELKTARETYEEAAKKLAKYGPTKWNIKSVSQIIIDQIMDKINKPVLKMRGKGKDELTSKQISYTREVAREICKRGIIGWENLIDADTGEVIPFDISLISELPHEITTELSNQISGNIDEEEVRNLN